MTANLYHPRRNTLPSARKAAPPGVAALAALVAVALGAGPARAAVTVSNPTITALGAGAALVGTNNTVLQFTASYSQTNANPWSSAYVTVPGPPSATQVNFNGPGGNGTYSTTGQSFRTTFNSTRTVTYTFNCTAVAPAEVGTATLELTYRNIQPVLQYGQRIASPGNTNGVNDTACYDRLIPANRTSVTLNVIYTDVNNDPPVSYLGQPTVWAVLDAGLPTEVRIPLRRPAADANYQPGGYSGNSWNNSVDATLPAVPDYTDGEHFQFVGTLPYNAATDTITNPLDPKTTNLGQYTLQFQATDAPIVSALAANAYIPAADNYLYVYESPTLTVNTSTNGLVVVPSDPAHYQDGSSSDSFVYEVTYTQKQGVAPSIDFTYAYKRIYCIIDGTRRELTSVIPNPTANDYQVGALYRYIMQPLERGDYEWRTSVDHPTGATPNATDPHDDNNLTAFGSGNTITPGTAGQQAYNAGAAHRYEFEAVRLPAANGVRDATVPGPSSGNPWQKPLVHPVLEVRPHRVRGVPPGAGLMWWDETNFFLGNAAPLGGFEYNNDPNAAGGRNPGGSVDMGATRTTTSNVVTYRTK